MDQLSSLTLEESKEEAAQILFDPSQLMLLSLTHSLPVTVIRRRLLAHIAGAPAPIHSPPHSPATSLFSSNSPQLPSHLPYNYSSYHRHSNSSPFSTMPPALITHPNLSISATDDSTTASWDAMYKRPIIAPLRRPPKRNNTK